MKKIIGVILAIFIVAAALSSCTYPDPYGLAHPPVEEGHGDGHGGGGH